MSLAKKYRIGLEASSVLSHKPSGIPRYIQELAYALSECMEREPDLELELCYRGSRIRKMDCRPVLPLDYRWHWPVPGLSTHRYDLMHSLDTTLPWFLPENLVCTIHDLFSIVLDEYSSPGFRRRKIRAYKRIVRSCGAIIVPSNTTGNDLVEHLGCPKERVCVVPHGVGARFIEPKEGGGTSAGEIPAQPYVLCFGPQRRKNLLRVLQAFEESGLFETHCLLVVGSLDPEAAAYLQKNKIKNRVFCRTGVPDEVLSDLYGKASLLCYPSTYEGFGLPVLEAMASGVPVVTGRTGATAELGMNHAVLVDPLSVWDIARGMAQALNFDRARLEQAKAYAQTFTWQKTAEATLSVYKRILGI